MVNNAINRTEQIDFYFDFSSAYSYLAQTRVAEIEQQTGLTVNWCPILLGVVYQISAHTIPSSTSAKMQYLLNDIGRCAKELGIVYQTPEKYPFNGIEAMRFYYFFAAKDQAIAIHFVQRVFDSAYQLGLDMSDSVEIKKIVEGMGFDYLNSIGSQDFQQAKQILKFNTQKAIDSAIFGAPMFVYRSELFWGADRIDTLISSVKFIGQ